MVEATRRDLRHALRGLARNPGYAAVFVVTLGLGIGANTAMFSAVNGVLLRPLPYDDADRLVYLRHSASLAGIENALFSVPEIEDYRRGVGSLEAVAEFSSLTFTMLGLDDPRRVRAGIVTGNYFDVMGLSATRGRAVGPADDGEDAPAVIVLSDRYWRSTFGADPDVVGTTVTMNGRTATVVGIAEPAPPYPERTDIYVNMAASPHHLDATMNTDRVHRMTEVFGRLAPGATLESVRTEAAAVSTRIHGEHPEAYDPGSGFAVTVTPFKAQLTRRARPTLLLLQGTALFVLIIACANLANLTLSRVLRRDHELAIRVSLGGSPGALRRELLVESLLLAGAGAALGLLLASGSLELLIAFAGRFTARAAGIALDGSVFVFALVAAVGASVFFTVLPAMPDGNRVGPALSSGGARSTAATGARRTQRALIVAQVATSFVLLVGAGLFVRTMVHLSRVDPGFETAHILTMDVPASGISVPGAELRSQRLAMLSDIRALPGVEEAAWTSSIPLGDAGVFNTQMELDVEGYEPADGAPHPRADMRVVSPGYFRAMGIEVLRGRAFTSTDVEDAQEVVVINESMARTYFGDRDPLGRRIAWTDEVLKYLGLGSDWRTVVGVVADTRDQGLDADVIHTAYNPYGQVHPLFTQSLVVRATREPGSILPSVREAILAHDANQPVSDVATMEDRGVRSVAEVRLNALLLGGFALLALVIAAVGIGGVLAFSVGSRMREFGVRNALGAARHRIWSGVVLEGAALAAVGVAIGALAALGLSRFVAGLLVGVPPLDPVTYVAVGFLLGGVAILATWAPAWRAARVDPLVTLGE
jgi:predicted permease